jgi:hypothetical protein
MHDELDTLAIIMEGCLLVMGSLVFSFICFACPSFVIDFAPLPLAVSFYLRHQTSPLAIPFDFVPAVAL